MKCTALIMVALAFMFLLGLLIPQKELMGKEAYLAWRQSQPGMVAFLDALQLMDIYASIPVLVLWGLFFLNLTIIMVDRTPTIVRRCSMPSLPTDSLSLQRGRHAGVLSGNRIQTLAATLKKHGYAVISSDVSLVAVRNRFASLATLFFHFSFFLILVGGVITFYTKFRGEADVAVGEIFNGAYTKVLQKPKISSIPACDFEVREVRPTYYNRTIATDLKVVIRDTFGERFYGINRPYRCGNLSFVVSDIDVAPFFGLKDSTGRELDGAFVKLKVLKGSEDSFKMGGYTIKVRFFTDVTRSTRETSRDTTLPQALKQVPSMQNSDQQGREIVNPACAVDVLRGGQLVASGILKPGESLLLDGASLEFADLAYWVHFYAGSERGLSIVYAGFILMILALVVRFCFYRRELRAFVHEGATYVSGTAEYYQYLFSEQFSNICES